MPPRDAGVEWETASPQSTTVAPDVVAVPTQRIPTGARLGWWRSLLGVGAVLVGVRYVVWQASIAPTTVLGVLFVVAETTSVVVLAVTVLTLLDRGSRSAPRPPSGTLDVFVTVCGEPPEVVEVAVRSALAIDYPHRTYVLNDGRIAAIDGWEAIDELAARLGAQAITRTTGARSKAGNLNHALRLTVWRVRRHDRRRPPSRFGPRGSAAALVRRRAGRLRHGNPTVRRRGRRAQQPAAVLPPLPAAGQGRRRLRDLVRQRRDLPPRRTRRRQRFQRVEHRRGLAHVVPAACGRMDQRVRARAGHDGSGAEYGSRVRPPAREMDGRRAAVAAARLPSVRSAACRCVPASTTCTRPARTSSACHCSCSSRCHRSTSCCAYPPQVPQPACSTCPTRRRTWPSWLPSSPRSSVFAGPCARSGARSSTPGSCRWRSPEPSGDPAGAE